MELPSSNNQPPMGGARANAQRALVLDYGLEGLKDT
jgi:hypothetical protein